MKKLLPLVLLIVGCNIFGEKEGICVLINMETNTILCYPQRPESQCRSDAENNETITPLKRVLKIRSVRKLKGNAPDRYSCP